MITGTGCYLYVYIVARFLISCFNQISVYDLINIRWLITGVLKINQEENNFVSVQNCNLNLQ